MFRSFTNISQCSWTIDPEHPLNTGRLAWWLSIPSYNGSANFHNLIHAYSLGRGNVNGNMRSQINQSNGITTYYTPGVANTSLSINMPAFTSSQAWTFIVWFRGVNFNTGNGFMPAFDDTSRVWTFFIDKTGKNPGFGGTMWNFYPAATVLSSGQWNQLGVAYNGNTGGTNTFYYLNGILIISAGQPGGQSTAAASLHFGDNPSGGGTAGQFYYQSVGLWNRQLSSNEVLLDYQLNSLGYPGVLRKFQQTVFSVQAGGGSTFTRTVSDNLALQESLLKQVSYFRLQTDNLALSDTNLRRVTTLRSLTDNLALSDSVLRTVTTLRVLADNLALSDSNSRLVNVFRLLTDNLAFSDSVTLLKAGIILVTLADNLGLAENVLRTVNSLRIVSDNLALSDVVLRAVNTLRSLSDNLGLADANLRKASVLRLLFDSLAFSDALTVLKTSGALLILIVDNLGLQDSVLRTVTNLRTISDNLGLSDSVLRSTLYSRVLSDNLGLSEVVGRAVIALRTITDNLGLQDNIIARTASAIMVTRIINLIGSDTWIGDGGIRGSDSWIDNEGLSGS